MSDDALTAVVTSAARLEKRGSSASRRGRGGRVGLVGASALLFATAASATILWSASMSDMGQMTMPGGWTLSMLWMRMPGQTWLTAGAAFLGMWTAMTIAMMLPSLVPALWHFVEGVCAGAAPGSTGGMRPLGLAALIGAGYFSLWTVLGVGVFLLGILLASCEIHDVQLAHAAPFAADAVIIAAGLLQFTAWKMRHLALCREPPCSSRWDASPPNAVSAFQCGLRLGFHCSLCTVGLTAILLVLGMMDLRAMTAVTLAITAERLGPANERIARALGAVALAAGLTLLISAV